MKLTDTNRYVYTFFLISFIIIIAYSNTLNASWHLDDMHNIVNNPGIQIKDLRFESIKNSMFSQSGRPDRLYRPVSCLTFAINALAGGTDTKGYHIFNIFLHICTTILLIYFIGLLFKTPAVFQSWEYKKNFIAIVSALLWSLNPVQTQAVTYIVQRMALLSAFFTLLALVFYLKSRFSSTSIRKKFFLMLVFLSTALSIFSKENGVITPLLIFLAEYIFFKKNNGDNSTKSITAAALTLFILIASAGCFILGFNFFNILDYSDRPFTLYERLLTQPGVVLFYLSLIFYPLPQRLSIEHDIVIAKGLLTPLYTLPCIAAVVILIISGFYIARKHPLTGFSILFYFTGHAVESTALPLEIIFEHRNYLPSMLMFVPITMLIFNLIEKYNNRVFMKTLIIVFTIALIFLFSFGTYNRNNAWSSEETLIMDAMIKAPDSARAKQGAGYLYDIKGNREKAIIMYHQSLSGFAHTKSYRAITFLDIGIILNEWKDYSKAIEYLDMAAQADPNLLNVYCVKAEVYMNMRQWDMALGIIEKASRKWESEAVSSELAGVCNIQKSNYSNALQEFRKAFELKKDSISVMLGMGECLSLMGYNTRADFFFKRASIIQPEIPEPYLWAAKNHFLSGDEAGAKKFLFHFFRASGAENVKTKLDALSNNNTLPLINIDKMNSFIKKAFDEYKNGI